MPALAMKRRQGGMLTIANKLSEIEFMNIVGG